MDYGKHGTSRRKNASRWRAANARKGEARPPDTRKPKKQKRTVRVSRVTLNTLGLALVYDTEKGVSLRRLILVKNGVLTPLKKTAKNLDPPKKLASRSFQRGVR